MQSKFRYDINGLRAYAVALVVLFHFQIPGFSSGFIGVDVFFVISGYLMTKIIIDQLMQDRFSIWKFYLARGIRILPALLALTTVIAIAGWFLLIPEDYKTYGKHAASSITFLSNIAYLRESSDYFSTAAHEKILLHTWSLSVEWQFYIILPIVLLIIGKIKKNRTILNSAIVIGFFISIFLSYKISQSSQSTAFYMIPTRAWEMLSGGLVYAYFSQIALSNFLRKSIEILGFGLIITSLIIFEKTTLWPSVNALLPVFGSMLILVANNQNSFLTKPKIFQLTGDASYSIYLWHWPIVFFLGYLGYQNDNLMIIIAILLSLILGWLGYRFIETPSRIYLNKTSLLKSAFILISITLILSSIFALIFLKNGIPQRASYSYLEETKELAMPSPNNGWCFYDVSNINSLQIGDSGLNCKVGEIKNSNNKALLFGDSFAGHNIPFWDEVGKKLNTQVHAVSTNWCYPSISDDFPDLMALRAFEQCRINRKFLSENLQKYDYLIFAGFWKNVIDRNQLNSFENLLVQANKLSIPIIIMPSPYSFNKNIAKDYKKAIWLGNDFKLESDDDYDLRSAEANEIVKKMASKYSNVIFLERADLYSKTHLTEAGYPYSLDGVHISILGSKASASYFEMTPKFQYLSNQFK
ncbi:acyltransferase family protein [Acinetobacter schindleri]|uniref:acyltransferase family protein n=1 Tax=Acinetobacter schindleri TaxID=108981 RepID=UPI001D0EFC9F|nr:acyltransferase family protein [Acinetobacter schindleri]